MLAVRLPVAKPPPGTDSLRAEVREFLNRELAGHPPELRAKSWLAFDPEFSRKMAERGWIGMTWPQSEGGAGRSILERYVVVEEMLAAGAPVAAHWTGDRQSGPMLLRFGSPEQRRRFLPGMRAGMIFFCIGMSEPDSGSDLASVRTRARKVEGGWRLNGTKIWTSNAHRSDYMIALVRTGDVAESKHAGLSQFIIDLSAQGIGIRPIADLTGENHFNEVIFDDAFVPDDLLVGKPGDGWTQVTHELALERSGPERFMSSLPLLLAAADIVSAQEGGPARLGRLLAHLLTLRQMSVAVASMLTDGQQQPALEAALIKDLGMTYEQTVADVLDDCLAALPPAEVDDAVMCISNVVATLAPSFSLRGGTREILRGIIAKGVGAR